MKKNKLLLATAILATALGTASLNQNIKAETAGVTNGTHLTIKKTIVNYNDSEVLMPKTTFTFVVKPLEVTGKEKDTASGLKIQKGIDGVKSQEIKYDNAVKPKDKEKSVELDFSTVQFPNVGIYRYEVSEQAGDVKGITYDSKKWTVDVYVVNKVGGGFEPRYIVSRESGKDEKKPILFENSFDTTSLTVKKRVDGNTGDKQQEFEFKLLLEENDYFVKGQKVTLNKTTAEGVIENIQVPIGEEYTFKLKDNEQVKLDKLPVGIKYKVDEVSKNQDNYQTTATIKQGDEVAEKYDLYSEKETDKTADEIVVTNKRDTQVPTGVVGTLAPFAVLSIVAIGGVIYITKRKKA
ncbi:T antigen/fimbrial major structural protein Tee11 [Streptococcus pyogenes]|nr:QVPTGV class sortase B protein-sorting domain-containing protein [Streptococcus pyogenes]HER4651882.1 QVPTGV class sortase B protein-sorting domain-containing protein [Streptococcus pyogenes NGAS505]KGE60507.1 sortase B signal, QVPTGV class domain protein [Streptococcus pyogenes SS1447]VGR00094.1 T antigen/fimbrial major structural protein Tee11 [Streptococcus pyogenes]VGR70232.1 T antigen/fimbrial major structural protein Tee11 [Streptococcus pyogenes]VGR74466.1 T antigen/fimbrial major st